MFQSLTLHGETGALVLGWQDAVVVRAWRIVKREGEPWRLTATVARVNPYLSRQRPLLFSPPRPGGYWAWPVIDLQLGAQSLTATLGAPQQ